MISIDGLIKRLHQVLIPYKRAKSSTRDKEANAIGVSGKSNGASITKIISSL